MTEKSNAERLVDSSHLSHRVGWQREAAAELRRIPELERQRDQLLEKLEAWQSVCDRITDQYGGVVAGVDFGALGRSTRAVISKATGAIKESTNG